MNLKLMLEEATSRFEEKTAIVSGDLRMSYADLNKASNRIANALIESGVNKGDRVAMLLSNTPEFVASYFGIVKAGAIAVPLDNKYKIDELTSLFNDSQPKVLIAESPALEPLIPLLPKFNSIRQVIRADSGCRGQFLSYQHIMKTGSARKIENEPGLSDVALIVYTSGPSLCPKGVMLSHQALVTEAAISSQGFQQTEKDIVMLFALPMYHVLGLVTVLLTSLYAGSTVVIVPGTGLSLGSLMATIEREKGTILLGVPYIFALAVNLAEKEGVKNDLSSLRLCVSAGAPLPVDVIQEFKQHYGFDIADCYGLTEATCLVTCPPLNDTSKIGAVGKALPGWEVRIVDDNGRELPPNRPGEIVVSGPIMNEYYNKPQITAETIKDGWVYTGDIGKIGEDGYIFITGRKKEMIIVKGQKAYPSDIESVLRDHPKVAEVAAIGIPDKLRGEVAGAAVILKKDEMATEHEIKQFCLKHMVDYKVPKQVVFLDSLPKNVTGRVDKKSLLNYFSMFTPATSTRKEYLSGED